MLHCTCGKVEGSLLIRRRLCLCTRCVAADIPVVCVPMTEGELIVQLLSQVARVHQQQASLSLWRASVRQETRERRDAEFYASQQAMKTAPPTPTTSSLVGGRYYEQPRNVQISGGRSDPHAHRVKNWCRAAVVAKARE